MKAWITKYALTDGIREAEGEISGRMFVMRGKGLLFDQHFHGKDWHLTREQAIERADEMRQQRIASLKKSLAAMEKLSFT